MINDDLLKKVDRIHPYPAKYPVETALKYILMHTCDNDLVYDPFCGSGTTLLASRCTGRQSIGTDINHIAVLISKFKTLSLTDLEVEELKEYINDFKATYINKTNNVKPFYYNSIEHWFCKSSIAVLSVIKDSINKLNENEQIFCKTVMSSVINTFSNQESDTRYAAVEKPYLTTDYAADVYIKKFNETLNLYSEFNNKFLQTTKNTPILADAVDCTSYIRENSVDLILTSPPYINTYDYYLYHKHRMYWLDYDVKYSMNNEIGSRREFSSLKKSKSKFTDDLKGIFMKCNKVLKPGGMAVIIIGDGKVSGSKYDAKINTENILSDLGWVQTDYSYTNLDDTSRAFRKSYRTKGKKEHILTFRKGV